MHTLRSETREALKRSSKNILILQRFHNDGNRGPDLLLELCYTPNSVRHKVLEAGKRMHTLCSETREALKCSWTNQIIEFGIGLLQYFHDDGNRGPDLLLELCYTPASVGHKAFRADKKMHTLLSETKEAPKRSPTNLVGLAGILQQFHNDRNRSPDLLLAFRYTPASVGHKALRVDKRMYTLFSETREAFKRNQMNPAVGILK
jgi:hypothetical protein